MHRSDLVRGAIVVAVLATGPAFAQNAATPARQGLMQQCRTDIATYCAGVTPGNGAIKACVKENFRSFSDGCKAALRQVIVQKRGSQTGL